MSQILNSVLPVFMLIALGTVLKRTGWTDDRFHRTCDRLVYYIFFPAMLFWKIGSPQTSDSISWKAALAAVAAVVSVYLLSLLYAVLTRMEAGRVGSFSQACYRFNTYVGMAIVLAVFGESGVRNFAVIISVSIPMINFLAVGTLIWFAKDRTDTEVSLGFFIKSIVSNPLILACFLGLVYSRLGVPFPGFVDSSLRLMAWVSLPLALLSIGGSLTVPKLKAHFLPAAASAGFKLIALPCTGWFFLRLFNVDPRSSAVAMIFFTLPTSAAIYILSSQLHSDADLASASIVLSTVLSLVSLSVAVMLFAPR